MNTKPPASPVSAKNRLFSRIGLAIALILLIPLILFFGLFPLIQERPFDSIEELNVDQIRRLEVRLYNRTDLDGGDDVGPYLADPADYERLLKPLEGISEVPGYENARGPWLGEYRILLKNGRKGTIRFYWVPSTGDPPTALILGSISSAACMNLAMSRGQIAMPAPRLRFEIGLHKYQARTAKELITVAERGASQGVPRRK